MDKEKINDQRSYIKVKVPLFTKYNLIANSFIFCSEKYVAVTSRNLREENTFLGMKEFTQTIAYSQSFYNAGIYIL